MIAPTIIIPEAAREHIEATFEDGTRRTAFYELDGERVGFRCWHEDGSLAMEYSMRGGVMHGPFRTYWENGQVSQESTYVEGKEHGLTKQYDAEGALLGSYTMDYGTGVDLWFDRAGVLSEERHYHDGQRHGYERWWCGDNTTVWQEEHFRHGEAHGIFRQWNNKGRLRRGFPRYYVGGKQVTKRQYERARLADPTLPPVVPEEHLPNRVLPPSLRPSSGPGNRSG
jgi:antitoxin component YwqK of YwqJK toxin-antitoxin module